MIRFVVCTGWPLGLPFHWEREKNRQPKLDGSEERRRRCTLYCCSALDWIGMGERRSVVVPGGSGASIDMP